MDVRRAILLGLALTALSATESTAQVCRRALIASAMDRTRLVLERPDLYRREGIEKGRSIVVHGAQNAGALGQMTSECGCPPLGREFYSVSSSLFAAASKIDDDAAFDAERSKALESFNRAMRMLRNNECEAILKY